MNKSRFIFFAAAAGCLTPWISSPSALVLGFILSSLGLIPSDIPTGRITKKLLAWSIIGLGFGIHLNEALSATGEGIGLIVATIFGTLLLGSLVTRLMGLNQKTGYLIAAGTAICGGSAIAAVSPAIKANDEQTALALATVFVLNSIALFIFPVIGHTLALDQDTFGTWAAIAIHDTSSVVGAASAYGEQALKTATTLKLARALWIIPVALLSAALFNNSNNRLKVPFFILFYCIAILVSDYLPQYEPAYQLVFTLAKRTLVLCLFLIGCSISVSRLRSAGTKPMLYGLGLWITISVTSLSWLYWHM